MNVQRPGLVAGTPFENSESESSEPGSPAAARWVEASAEAEASAAASQRQVVAPTAEERPGEGPRQEAVSRTRAWREAGDIDEPLDLSSLSLTALSVPLVTGLRRLNVNNN